MASNYASKMLQSLLTSTPLSTYRLQLALSDKFDPVSARLIELSFMQRKDRATRQEPRTVSACKVSAGERSFLVEVVVYGGIKGGEFLQTSDMPETLHRAFSSSERKVRVLGAIVEPPARLLFFEHVQFSEYRVVRRKTIRQDLFGTTIALHKLLDIFQYSMLILAFCDNHLQHSAFVVDGVPKVRPPAVDLHKDLIQMPLPFRVCSQFLNTLYSEF